MSSIYVQRSEWAFPAVSVQDEQDRRGRFTSGKLEGGAIDGGSSLGQGKDVGKGVWCALGMERR